MPATVNLTLSTRCTFGPVLLTCTSGGTPYPLAGLSAFAEVRRIATQRNELKTYGDIVLDLAPVIAVDDAAGLITIPEIDFAITKDLCPMVAEWDLILQDADGNRWPPSIAGRFTITNTVTQPQ